MRINEIFYSIQGEGRWTGTPAVFVRFSGCNLKCGFCDTRHEEYKTYTEADLVREIAVYDVKHVILTGGEPTLQLTRSFVDKLHQIGRYVHIETNGTRELQNGLKDVIDWITLSPKDATVHIQRADEVKVVYYSPDQDMERYEHLHITNEECWYLQPCDTGNAFLNDKILERTINYILQNPKWKLSLQTQKILNVR